MELSLNQATTRPYPLTKTAEAASAAGIRNIGLWLEPVAELGAQVTKSLLSDTGLTPTSMCRSGFVAGKSAAELDTVLSAVKRDLDLCAEVGAPYLTFIAGGLPEDDRSVANAECRVRDALAQLVPHAQETGVRLALEPLHPLFVTDRSIVTTIDQALRVVADLDSSSIGVLVDAWATFWDPDISAALGRAGAAGRLFGYQVNDFALPLPLPENMNGRVMPGDGLIDLAALTEDVLAAGYADPIEVEVFNEDIWTLPLEEIISQVVDTFDRSIAAPLSRTEVH